MIYHWPAVYCVTHPQAHGIRPRSESGPQDDRAARDQGPSSFDTGAGALRTEGVPLPYKSATTASCASSARALLLPAGLRAAPKNLRVIAARRAERPPCHIGSRRRRGRQSSRPTVQSRADSDSHPARRGKGWGGLECDDRRPARRSGAGNGALRRLHGHHAVAGPRTPGPRMRSSGHRPLGPGSAPSRTRVLRSTFRATAALRSPAGLSGPGRAQRPRPRSANPAALVGALRPAVSPLCSRPAPACPPPVASASPEILHPAGLPSGEPGPFGLRVCVRRNGVRREGGFPAGGRGRAPNL